MRRVARASYGATTAPLGATKRPNCARESKKSLRGASVPQIAPRLPSWRQPERLHGTADLFTARTAFESKSPAGEQLPPALARIERQSRGFHAASADPPRTAAGGPYFTRDPNRARTSASSSEHLGANILMRVSGAHRRVPPRRASCRAHSIATAAPRAAGSAAGVSTTPRWQRRVALGHPLHVPLHRPLAQLGDGEIHATGAAAPATPHERAQRPWRRPVHHRALVDRQTVRRRHRRAREARRIAALGEGRDAAASHRGRERFPCDRREGWRRSFPGGRRPRATDWRSARSCPGPHPHRRRERRRRGQRGEGRGAGCGLDRGTVGGRGGGEGCPRRRSPQGRWRYAPRGEGEGGRGDGRHGRREGGALAQIRGDPRECLRWRGRGSHLDVWLARPCVTPARAGDRALAAASRETWQAETRPTWRYLGTSTNERPRTGSASPRHTRTRAVVSRPSTRAPTHRRHCRARSRRRQERGGALHRAVRGRSAPPGTSWKRPPSSPPNRRRVVHVFDERPRARRPRGRLGRARAPPARRPRPSPRRATPPRAERAPGSETET